MSKKTASYSLAIISTTLCLLLSLTARNASAAATVNVWWADNGTGTPTSGTWDNTTANWDIGTNLSTAKITFTNGTTFPEFAAGNGTTISSLTINVNANVTCAGMASGITGDGVTDITFSTTNGGSIGIVTNNGALTIVGTNTNYVQGIFCEGSVGNFTFNVPIVGAGGIQQHGNNYIALYASNSYAGGTALTGDQVVYYNNNNSFGTGPILLPDYGNALVNGGTNAVTISNNLIFTNAGVAVNLASGNPVAGAPGTTWAGNFSLPVGTTTIETSSTATEETAITGVISGTGGVNLTVTDLGILILASSNTYDGVTTITQGPVVLGSPENPGVYGPMGAPASIANSLVMTGGNLRFTSTNTYDYSGRLNAASSTAYNFDLNGQTVTFASTIGGGAGLTNFSALAGAMLTLSGPNTYSGGTSISNTTVSVSTINDSGTSSIGSGPVYMNRATLLYTGTGDSTGREFIGASGTTNVIDVPSGVTINLAGEVFGTGTWYINKVDTGTLTFSGTANNSFLGLNVLGGTVILDDTTSPGTTYAINETTTVASGATLQLSGSGGAEISNTVSVTVSSGGVFDLNAQSDTISTLNISGSGISSGGALINSAASTTSTLTCGVNLVANLTMGGSGNITLPGVISGFGMAVTYSGTGILELQGVNTYNSGTTVSSGTLDINAGFIPGNITLSGTGTLQVDATTALSSAATLTLPASPAASTINLTYSGTENIANLVIGSTTMPPGTYGIGFNNPNNIITGPGLLVVSGNSYWDANGTDASSSSSAFGGGSGNWNTSASDWWVSGNSDSLWATDALAVFAGSTAGTVTVTANVNADELTFTTTGYTITNSGGSILTLDGNAPAISVSTGAATIGCPVVESGVNPLTINGPGALTLSGTNSFTGGTAIYNGATVVATTIADNTNCSIGQSGAVTIWGGGGTLAYTGAAPATTGRTITLEDGSTTSYLNVPASAGPLTLSGQVHNVGNSAAQTLTLTGGGTVNLGGTVDNASLTMAINSGTVVITKTSASTAHGLGGGASTVGTGTPSNSAILQLAGSGNYDLFSTCTLTVKSPDGELDLNGQNDDFSTLTLSGSGPTGIGALINSSGTASAITNTGSAVVLAGNTTIGGSGNITLASVVSGSGMALTYDGTGTLILNAANTYTGGTTVNSGGKLQINTGGASSSSAGTGTIALNGTGTLIVNVGNTALPNTVTGGSSSIIDLNLSTGNLFLSNSPSSLLSGFSGTFNVNYSAVGGQLVVGNGATEIMTLNAGATWNVGVGAVLDFNGLQIDPATVILQGLANPPNTSAANGALRVDGGSLQSGPVILMGNSSIGNGLNITPGTISGVISSSGGSYGFIKMGADPIVLTATNTYTGFTTISNGALSIGGAGLLGSGSYAGSISNYGTFIYNSSAAQTLAGVISGTGGFSNVGPGTLTLTATNTYTGATTNTATGVLVIGGNGSLNGGTYAGSIVNSGSFTYSSSVSQTLSGVVSGSGSLAENGPGTLTLSGTNTYTGITSVGSGGTLALASTGSINDTALISIAAGGILDVSAYPSSFGMPSGITLNAGGTGTNAGSTAATIKGGSSASIDVAGPVTLTFTPVAFTGDTNHPALYVSQGVLTLSGSGITVSNAAATPLGAGTYTLIQVANSFVPTVFSTNVTVTGTGLAPGTAASLSESAGIVSLVVVTTFVPQPKINSFSRSGGNLIFSGTNGPANGTYYVLTSTNVALPTTNWTSIETNTFSPTGTFSVTNAIGTNRSQFFIIEIP